MSEKIVERAKQRYATKVYDPKRRVDESIVDAIVQTLQLSPSSVNSQPWRFYIVSDEDMKARLADVSLHNKEKIKQASHLIVFAVATDLDDYENNVAARAIGDEGAQKIAAMRVQNGDPNVKAWLKNQVYIALGVALSAAAALGVDSTPMEGIEHDAYREILRSGGYEPIVAMALGYHSSDDYNHPTKKPKRRLAIDDVVVRI